MEQIFDLNTVGDFITKVGFPIALIVIFIIASIFIFKELLMPYFKKKLNINITRSNKENDIITDTFNQYKQDSANSNAELKAYLLDNQNKMEIRFNEQIRELKDENNKDKERFDRSIDLFQEAVNEFKSIKNEVTDIKTDVESIKETVSKATPKKTTARKKPTVQK